MVDFSLSPLSLSPLSLSVSICVFAKNNSSMSRLTLPLSLPLFLSVSVSERCHFFFLLHFPNLHYIFSFWINKQCHSLHHIPFCVYLCSLFLSLSLISEYH